MADKTLKRDVNLLHVCNTIASMCTSKSSDKERKYRTGLTKSNAINTTIRIETKQAKKKENFEIQNQKSVSHISADEISVRRVSTEHTPKFSDVCILN